MKILLTLFVLLFSSSVLAENIPISLFGIELNKSIKDYRVEDAPELRLKKKKININDNDYYIFNDYFIYYDGKTNFINKFEVTNFFKGAKNLDDILSFYYLYSNSEGKILGISAQDNNMNQLYLDDSIHPKELCSDHFNKNMKNISENYNLTKEDFAHLILHGNFSKDNAAEKFRGEFYIDRYYLEFNKDDSIFVFALDCEIEYYNTSFIISLFTKEMQKDWDSLFPNEIVNSINFDFLTK